MARSRLNTCRIIKKKDLKNLWHVEGCHVKGCHGNHSFNHAPCTMHHTTIMLYIICTPC